MGLRAGDLKKMRFSLAVAVVLAGMSVSGWAQQNNTFKVKPAHPEKAAKPSAPIGKAGGTATAASANAKELQTAEHQSARGPASSRSAGNAGKKTTPALKPVKDKPNPPINFNGSGGAKTAGLANQSSNPYRGRLKQKGTGKGQQ
jgi:hypothetical protein